MGCNHSVILNSYHWLAGYVRYQSQYQTMRHSCKRLVPSLLVGLSLSLVSRTGSTADTSPLPTGSLTVDSVVARIGGLTIPYSELQASTEVKLAQMQRQYDSQLRQLTLSNFRAQEEYQRTELNKLVDNRVLALEAAAKKTSQDALLNTAKAPEVSDADVHSFYEPQRIQIGQPFETAEPQIRLYLQKQAAERSKRQYLDSLRAKYRASIQLEPKREEIPAVGPQRGPLDAKVTIVEFSDFQCPFCGRLAPILKQVLAAYPTQVRLVYRNMPLSSLHPDALNAAEAAVCAESQGKFWEMHDLLFAEQNSLSIDALKEKAKRVGLDTKQFDACLDSGNSRDAVNADAEAGAELGLAATPSSFVNGRFVNGAATFERWSAIINDELHRVALTARQ
jgi:protein-disulfide isomerase